MTVANANLDASAPTKDAPDRIGDVVDVEPRGGHLVQQGLERVKVVGVDDRDVNVGVVLEAACDPQPPEPGADHDDPMLARHFLLLVSLWTVPRRLNEPDCDRAAVAVRQLGSDTTGFDLFGALSARRR